jgi:hypothetical protein
MRLVGSKRERTLAVNASGVRRLLKTSNCYCDRSMSTVLITY